jgi:hypothetical protein
MATTKRMIRNWLTDSFFSVSSGGIRIFDVVLPNPILEIRKAFRRAKDGETEICIAPETLASLWLSGAVTTGELRSKAKIEEGLGDDHPWVVSLVLEGVVLPTPSGKTFSCTLRVCPPRTLPYYAVPRDEAEAIVKAYSFLANIVNEPRGKPPVSFL